MRVVSCERCEKDRVATQDSCEGTGALAADKICLCFCFEQSKPEEVFMVTRCAQDVADQWMNEQMFEEDLRAVMSMLRPHRQERIQGWSEYRTGGKHFRATISWDEHFEMASEDIGLSVPCITEVLETILVGSARKQDDLTAAEEFEIYRQVLRELYRRLDSLQACYE